MTPHHLNGLRVYASAPRPRENWGRHWRACLALTLASLATCAWAPIADAHREYRAVWMIVRASAYCPGACCTDGDGRTATMRDASRPGVAVDPAVIRLGSRLDIPGIGPWILADDVGGRVRGASIDIRKQSHEEATAYGRRTIRVRVWSRSR